jgi:hypothetical protein
MTIIGLQSNFVGGKALVGQEIRNALTDEFPYVVSMIRIEPEAHNLQSSHFCTGTLISHQNILTGAHCILDENIVSVRIIVGSVNLYHGKQYVPLWWISFNDWAESRSIPILYQVNDIACIKVQFSFLYDTHTCVHTCILKYLYVYV